MTDKEPSAALDLGDIAGTLTGTQAEMRALSSAARSFGSAISTALKGAAIEGKAFDDVLKTLGQRLLKIGADLAGRMIVSNLFGALQGALTPAAAGNVTAFAKGGIVDAPALFATAGGAGLMGESGAEAILPLARGADGRLGIRANAEAAPVSVVVNVTTPDAASFRTSGALIAGLLARAVDRGRRTL